MKTKIILLLLILSIILAACAASNEPSTKDENESQTSAETLPEESYLDKLGAKNFNGETFTIIHVLERDGMFFSGEELTGEPIKDASYMRDNLIEEKYNIKIEYVFKDYTTIEGLLRNSLASGDHLCDMIIISIITLSNPAVNNYLHNIAALPYITLDSPWWSKLIYENMTFDGKLYSTAGDIFPGMYMAPSATYVNHKLLEDYGITDNLYEMVFAGTWTLDVLERLTKDVDVDLNQDGRMVDIDDFFGFIHQNHTLSSNTFCAAMGIKMSTIKDNTIVVDLTSPTAFEKIERLSGFFKKITYNAGNDFIVNTFHNGKAIFITHYLESAFLYLRTMEDDYGILPVPKYDEAQDTHISALNPWNASSMGIPLLIEPEKVGFIIEALGYLSYEMIRPNVYELTLKTKLARNTESMKIVDLIIETSYLDLNSVYNFGGSTDIVRNTLFDKTPLLSAYNSIESKIQGAIDTYIEKLSEQ